MSDEVALAAGVDEPTTGVDEETLNDAWTRMADRLVMTEEGVEYGRMMSSPAVTVGGKVFAFYCANALMTGIGVKLGREFDIASLALADWCVLSPFKTRPPLKDWIVIGPGDINRWEQVARLALTRLRGY